MGDAVREDDGDWARVRGVMADSLGVETTSLAPHVSLRDDLAADSLDLLELALAIEDDLGISLPERVLDEVRTVGELVTATLAALRVQRAATVGDGPRVRARVEPPAPGRGVLERSDVVTPYGLDAVLEDVRRAGPGARVELVLERGAPAWAHERVQAALAALEKRGVTVARGQSAERTASRAGA